MNDYLERFIKLLKELFELDKSDLDFGIYRIINIRQREIMDYLYNRLPKKVTEILKPFAAAGKDCIRQKMTAIEHEIAQLGVGIDSLPDNAPKKQEYASLKKQLAHGADISALESDVYSALYSFFNRYYDEGDFISKRRYKEGVYAIPYEGEEVKLYWANQDQYYIKTSENFKDYSFVTDEGFGVHFRLVDATTEQNNNKEADDSKRTFMLYPESDERPELKTFEWDEAARELTIHFVYDVPADKKKKWGEANLKAIIDWLDGHSALKMALLRRVDDGNQKPLTVIEKHLKAYVAKNSFDYFIHKDLGGFLNRELDFFIKNEIMHLDDLDTDDERRAETYLAKVRAVKRIGKEIIAFLAQIENFQRKLWLKKKFVVETNWCITLDRIDERFYPEIIACKAQVQEWIDMYRIDEIKGDLATTAFTNPPTIDFLRENQNLIVDTSNFPTTFRDRLIASIDNLDDNTGGLMINGDNFHALRLLQKLYSKKIQSIYIDPPYNSPSSEVLYKNGYRDSSWITLINDRLIQSNNLLTEKGSIVIAIDKWEHNWLFDLCKQIYTGWDVTSIAIEHNKKGVQGGHFSFSNEYAIFCIPISVKSLNELPRDKEDWEYSQFRNWGSESERGDAANCFYPIYSDLNGNIVGYGNVLPEENHPNGQNNLISEGNILIFTQNSSTALNYNCSLNPLMEIWPIDDGGVERKWRYAFQSINGIISYLRIDISSNNVYSVKIPKHSEQFKTIWYGPKYNAGDNGTKVLTSLGIDKSKFGYPKSIYTVKDCIFAISNNDSIVLDYFAGSATTAQAVLMLNSEIKDSSRKYILVEMGEYFSTVTLPRVKKVVYSPEWKNGVPQRRDAGVSHIMKYLRLESYEDALSNISLEKKDGFAKMFGDQYLINYMLDIEAKGSLLNLDAFISPFDYEMKITEKNECHRRKVDVVETFNYLIGLTVSRLSAIARFKASDAKNPAYEGAVDLEKDAEGDYAFRLIEGTLPDGRRALVIWRNIKADNIAASNAALDAYFSRYRINPQDREFEVIFVNGDNNVENLRLDGERWKVVRTEAEFNRLMWTEQ